MLTGRLPAAAGAVCLVGLLALLVGLCTPWSPLPPAPGSGGRPAAADPARDFTATEKAREDSFHRAIRPPAYAGLLVGLAAGVLLGLTPLGARLVELSARPFGGGWLARAVLGALALTLAGRLVTLPFGAASEVVLRRYGLSTQTWTSWTGDQLRALAVAAVVLALVSVGFFALARSLPGTWWAWGALAAAALVFAGSFVFPLLIEPVFNKFTPLAQGELRTSLLQLAERDGVPVREVLVADASRRTTTVNAYVSGYGATRRIVVYDTLLPANPAEVRLIVAHELGHAKRQDVLVGTLEGAVGAAAAVCAGYLVLGWAPLLRRAGVSSPADPRSLALLVALVSLAGFLTQPLQTLISRRVEARADVHSLELTRDPATFGQVERRLALTNLSDLDPHPLIYALFATHPTAPERLALSREWAERNGVPAPSSQLPP